MQTDIKQLSPPLLKKVSAVPHQNSRTLHEEKENLNTILKVKPCPQKPDPDVFKIKVKKPFQKHPFRPHHPPPLEDRQNLQVDELKNKSGIPAIRSHVTCTTWKSGSCDLTTDRFSSQFSWKVDSMKIEKILWDELKMEDGKMNRKRSRNDEEDDVDEFEVGMEMRKKKEKKIGRR